MELKTEKVENMCGGEGHVIIKHILGEKELNGKCGLYAQVTIEPGCSLGYHEHHNESETYYILSGQGDYDDNGTVRPVKAGDVTFTPDNHGHGLKNTGDTDLVFMALIILFPFLLVIMFRSRVTDVALITLSISSLAETHYLSSTLTTWREI